jgi:tetratricopeptide (TPR) repeat protein
VATYTRHELKHDKLIDAAHSGASWIEENLARVVTLAVVAVVLLAAIIGGYFVYQSRSEQASSAFGDALKTYQSNIRPLNAPADPANESYATAQERAAAANKKFVAVADKYSMLEGGKNARYYAGITYAELGQNASAEASLKQAASGSRDVADLAKIALASLYHSTGRDSQAIDEYNDVIAHPSTTVPAVLGKLQLAALYESAGNMDQARKLWAQVKDADKTGTAGEIASDKLSGKAEPAGR